MFLLPVYNVAICAHNMCSKLLIDIRNVARRGEGGSSFRGAQSEKTAIGVLISNGGANETCWFLHSAAGEYQSGVLAG